MTRLQSAWQSISFAIKQKLRALNRARLQKRRGRLLVSYADWLANNEPARSPLVHATNGMTVTILVRSSAEAASELTESTLRSLMEQSHRDWFAWVSAPLTSLTTDPRIATAENEADTWPKASQWVLELHAGDELHPEALHWLLQIHQEFPEVQAVYADHDHIDSSKIRHSPHFKPQWDTDLHLATGYATDCCLMRIDLSPERSPRTWCTDSVLIDNALRGKPLQIRRLPALLLHRADTVRTVTHQIRLARILCSIQGMPRKGMDASISAATGTLQIHWPEPDNWPRVSIVIPTKDQLPLLRKCIESIDKTNYPNKQVIVVDNGSKEAGTLEFLSSLRGRPDHVVMHDDRPFNYSRLNNTAVRNLADGTVVALLNNDIEALEANWLKEMVKQALRPEIGCVGARLLYGNRTLQHGGVLLGIGKKWPTEPGIAAHAFKGLRESEPGYCGRAQATQQFSAVTAACLVVRRSVYDAVGGLNETELAVAFNDVDFCLRVRAAGYRNLWTPAATLFHHESVSRGRDVSAVKKERLRKESAYMQERWGAMLADDPAYNPNLTLTHASFELSQPSRSPYSRQ